MFVGLYVIKEYPAIVSSSLGKSTGKRLICLDCEMIAIVRYRCLGRQYDFSGHTSQEETMSGQIVLDVGALLIEIHRSSCHNLAEMLYSIWL